MIAIPDGNSLVVCSEKEPRFEGLQLVDLTVTDERVEGRIFRGTIEPICEEMKALKLELFVKGVLISVNDDVDGKGLISPSVSPYDSLGLSRLYT